MTDKMTVAIAAGGTAGHINPALALAEELRDRGHHVVFVGQSHKLEGRLVPEAGFDFVPITVTGFDRSRPWTALTSLWRVNKAKCALAKHFSKVGKPDAAIGFGAYVEVPLLGWCKGAGVPYLLHEQNSVPGLANKMMNSHAARVCISVPAARSVFEREDDPEHVLMTGNPLGRENLYVLHSTGADGFEETKRALALTPEEAKRYRVQPYIDNMGDMLAAADLVLSRSGASSVAEIAALAVPSVLVPYPHATADHQTTNARYLVDAGAGVLCTDADIDAPAFAEELLHLVDDAAARDAMRQAARGLAQDRAAALLADAVEGLR